MHATPGRNASPSVARSGRTRLRDGVRARKGVAASPRFAAKSEPRRVPRGAAQIELALGHDGDRTRPGEDAGRRPRRVPRRARRGAATAAAAPRARGKEQVKGLRADAVVRRPPAAAALLQRAGRHSLERVAEALCEQKAVSVLEDLIPET